VLEEAVAKGEFRVLPERLALAAEVVWKEIRVFPIQVERVVLVVEFFQP
jgi:hypothetical protein